MLEYHVEYTTVVDFNLISSNKLEFCEHVFFPDPELNLGWVVNPFWRGGWELVIGRRIFIDAYLTAINQP